MYASIWFRLAAMVLHVLLNVVIVGYLVRFDPSGSWLRFGLFVLSLVILLLLFVWHLVSFIQFVKSR